MYPKQIIPHWDLATTQGVERVYSKSVFNIEIESKQKIYLYNSYTNSLAEIEEDQYKLYNTAAYEQLDNIQGWLDMGFLVDARMNELSALSSIFFIMQI